MNSASVGTGTVDGTGTGGFAARRAGGRAIPERQVPDVTLVDLLEGSRSTEGGGLPAMRNRVDAV